VDAYRKILVGYLEHPEGRDAIALALILARLCGSEVLVANVSRTVRLATHDGSHTFMSEPQPRLEAAIRRAVDERRGGSEVGVGIRTVASPSPARGLHDLAESESADLLVIGAGRRRSARRLLGSVAQRLCHGSRCAIAVAPHGYADEAEHALKDVAVAFDGSAEAEAALTAARALAETAGAKLTLFTVVEPISPSLGRWIPLGGATAGGMVEYEDAVQRQWMAAGQLVERAANDLPERLVAAPRLLSGDPATRIAEEARSGFDLLVMGSRGYGAAGRVLLGSTSAAVVAGASRPVLITPRGG
jgi:nucleotide-binding universal stress UspA family protein